MEFICTFFLSSQKLARRSNAVEVFEKPTSANKFQMERKKSAFHNIRCTLKKKKKQSIKLEPNGLSRDPKNCPLDIRKASYRIWPDVDIAHELRHLIGSYTCISIVYQPIRVLRSLKYLHFSCCLRLYFLVFGHQKLHLS